jgi:glyoxylase-like metal-dependent hydrolase (beta-lactamase superfamily II)
MQMAVRFFVLLALICLTGPSRVFAQDVGVSLARLDCGTPRTPVPAEVNNRFSDTQAYKDLTITIVYSCYLIKHGNEYLLWDAGHSMSAGAQAPKVSLIDLLAAHSIKPGDIKYLAVSHYHRDHIGQANSFSQSTLLIGQGDWDVVTNSKPSPLIDPNMLSNWTEKKSQLETVIGDKDIFGDGTVVMLNTPGHTPGHHALLVKLSSYGNVILSGDLAHFRENYENNGVPVFNIDRAQTLASITRVKQLATSINAKVVIQHDWREADLLPNFPNFAR